ncbi:MAG: macro domain-containing protein [Deltaproteobacteria bacterium]|nr:macro domain-containing protein [Deltaproteobacteria bacterium]
MASLATEKKVKDGVIRVVKDDISAMDVEAFVFYAQDDLRLGAGYGNAIAVRGGPKIQEELKALGPCKVGDVVVTGAGKLKAKHILHAVGPKFQEEGTEKKLLLTMENILAQAEQRDIGQLAVPPLGCGFYGVPLDLCARVTLAAAKKHLEAGSKLREFLVVACDAREYRPFAAALEALV